MRKTGSKSSKSPKGPKQPTADITALMEAGTEIDKAVKRATRRAVLQHKKLGQSIVVWRDGRVVWIKPQDI